MLTKTKVYQQINSRRLWSNTKHPVQLTTGFLKMFFSKRHLNQKGGCPDTLDTPWISPWDGECGGGGAW